MMAAKSRGLQPFQSHEVKGWRLLRQQGQTGWQREPGVLLGGLFDTEIHGMICVFRIDVIVVEQSGTDGLFG